MNFRLETRSDWLRVVEYVGKLPWSRKVHKQMVGIRYRVTVDEMVPAKTTGQNALQHVMYSAAAKQRMDQDAEGYRAYCKLHFGLPILRNADDEYREAYDRVVRPLDYEAKIQLMRVPLDFPVTRIMSKAQLREYLDAVYVYLHGLGVQLERAA